MQGESKQGRREGEREQGRKERESKGIIEVEEKRGGRIKDNEEGRQ